MKRIAILEILLHLLFWALITLMPIISGLLDAIPGPFISPLRLFLINLLLAAQFYLNAFLWIPVFLDKRKQPWLYFVIFIVSMLILDFVFIQICPSNPFPNQLQDFGTLSRANRISETSFLLLVITAVSFAYRYLTDQCRQIKNQGLLPTQVSELAFLRSQISPHFIFNVINNVVALSRLNPRAVEPTLTGFSNLLRYVLYISDQQKISLNLEIEYLASYIELQQFRYSDCVRVNFTVSCTTPEKTIEPMLLVPFVENAFKHGVEDTNHSVINIFLNSDSHKLDFQVSNSVNPGQNPIGDAHGIGLNNVQRRLALLYPDEHMLKIDCSTTTYQITLQLQLK